MIVPWITGRRRALARALAMSLAEAKGLEWFEIPTQSRDRMVRAADAAVGDWIATGVLAEFAYDYRETEVE